MKKLIAIAVVFALVVGTAVAVDLGADVTASANVFQGKSKSTPLVDDGVRVSGGMNAVKLSGSGEVMDGKFGAAMRADFSLTGTTGEGFAWWKPIDQFKLIIGQGHVADGFWGKEGVTGWMFNQKAYDGIATGAGNIWGGGYSSVKYRNAFAEAYSGNPGVNNGIFMEIKPMDMLGINIGLPVFNGGKWDKNFFTDILFQVDLNFAFGNIAITYKENDVFLYFGGSFGAIALDVGLCVPSLIDTYVGTHPAGWHHFSQLYFGAGLKFSAGAFGVKFRTVAGIPVVTGAAFSLNAGVLPYFAINDNMCVFVNAEMGMDITTGTGGGLTKMGWTFNPYIRIGAEWGPSFYAGIQVEQPEVKGATDVDKAIKFAVPIGITVSY